MNAPTTPQDRVSRRRYERERRAREEAERLLEEKSRELWNVNEALRDQAAHLEEAVRARTADLEQAKKNAEHANAAKSAFLAMISHDIRTPLNGVLGISQVLADTNLTHDQAEMNSLIMSSGQTLMGLLNDVLDISKIEARQMDVEQIPVDVPALIRDIGLLFDHTAREKDLELRISIESPDALRVLTDPTRLRQIVNNLLSNALKFTDSGHVSLRTVVCDDTITVEVHDTGPGVAEDSRDTLFRAFTQTDSSIARKFGGTGLGLTISRELCRMMGGDLTYQSSPEGGACFRAVVHAPVAPDTIQPQHGPDPHSREGAREILTERTWRVLAAEDNMTNQKVLTLMLKPFATELTMVGNGLEAVKSYQNQVFDIVLLDINMPEMNGLEAASKIRAHERSSKSPRVPIIALTANAMTHQVDSYLREGIDAHIAKPIRRDDLAGCMAQLLSARSETSP